MKKLFIILFVILVGNVSGQCPYTVTASATPATCSTCCNGIITSTVSGFGCAPTSLTLQPLGIASPSGTWTNLCPGSYTVVLGTSCCIAYCGPITLSGGTTPVAELKSLDNEIKFYPNPVSNILHVFNPLIFECLELEVVNFLGQLVLKTTCKKEIDVSELPNGCYIIQITTYDKKYFHSKFIKE